MVPFFDYLRVYNTLATEIQAAIARVLASGILILGPEGEKFEQQAGRWLDIPYCTGVNSGTDALTIALKACSFPPGSEIITVANTTVPTIAAIRNAGYIPVFADIDETTYQINPDCIEPCITGKTRGIVAVHLYGLPAPVKKIKSICRRYKLKLIEDCAQAMGTRIDGKYTGTFGDIGCFSFYPTKNLGAYGDGGLCVTRNKKIHARIQRLRFYGYNKKRQAIEEGFNSRLDEIQAAILSAKLPFLKKHIRNRMLIARTYLKNIRHPGVILPPDTNDTAWHLFVIQSRRRNRLLQHLQQNGIAAAIHYPVPVHRMPAYRFLNYRAGSLPHTETACRRVISLPIFPGMAENEIQQVINSVNSF